MIPTRRFDQELPELLLEASTAPYPEYIDDVLGRTGSLRQRPAWTFPGRWLPMDLTMPRRTTAVPVRPLLLLALLALLIAALVVVAVGSRRPLPPPFGVADNGLIAYSEGGDILVVDPRIGVPRTIIAGTETDLQATFSPRGDRLAFLRDVAGEKALFVADADGSHARQLAGPIHDVVAMEWSPDGSRILFGYLENRREVLDIVRLDGSAATRIAIAATLRDPAWRPPDGREFAVRARFDGGGSDYVLVDADGGNIRPLHVALDPRLDPNEYYNLIAPAWSPDGTRFSFNTADLSAGPERPANHINVGHVDGDGRFTDQRRYVYDDRDSDEGFAIWSPDGTKFSLNVGARGADFWRVAVANSDGTGGLTYTGRPTITPQAMGHSWSPDGSTILAKYIEEHEAWLLDPAGGAGRQVPWGAINDDGPNWQRTNRG